MADLEQARLQINEIDRAMANLFEQRMCAVRQVAEYKKEHGLPINDPEREARVIASCTGYITDEEVKPYFVDFIQSNMDISKNYQSRLLGGMRVAFSGVKGAFADIAARRVFPSATSVAYPDFKAAYKAAESGECDCVILPIENSYNGDVGQVMDLIFFGTLHINGIYDIEVVHNLLANKGATLDSVRQVISHPQALGQCAEYIRKHGYEPVECVNTAVAAKTVAESGRTDIAAIGSDEAAESYGLRKLEAHINERSNNTTRFAVLTRNAKTPSGADKQFVMLFTVKNVAGSLGKAVSIIGNNGFNLRALKSRPTKELIWNYYFYAEGDGNIHSEKGKTMLHELKKVCNDLRVAGSFEKEMTLR